MMGSQRDGVLTALPFDDYNKYDVVTNYNMWTMVTIFGVQ